MRTNNKETTSSVLNAFITSSFWLFIQFSLTCAARSLIHVDFVVNNLF